MNSSWESHEPNGAAGAGSSGAGEEMTPQQEPVLATEPAPAKSTPPSPAAEDPGSGNIDKIRDILFGSNMREYEARFARLEQVLQRESANLRETTRKSLESLESFVKREVEALELRFRTERDDRASSFSQVTRELKELGEGLARRISEVDDHVAGSHHQLREQLLQHGRDTAEHIQGRQHEMTELLNQRFQELHKSKTDRAALASMFTELALRLNNEMQVTGVEH